ncbi:phage portal protein [Bacillus subtilis]|uniref:phage portal protein n=1 Tax=Bacillus subtilis TaxID=1423 RepID=UPI0022F39AB0|nr:phage portal protein [Bacillus subtilis]WBY39809.1 phage portal protein [Bacillus subtilis]
MFNKLIGKSNRELTGHSYFSMMNGFTPTFTKFGDDVYESDVVRAAIHAIASNAAKLKPKHIRRIDNNVTPQNSNIERLLSVRPNPHMNAYDFLYKVIAQLFSSNNSFILIQMDGDKVSGFYPINASNSELVELNDEMFVKFRFSNGKGLTVPYSEVIHLRRFFNNNDMFGDSNAPLRTSLELLHTSNEGMINAIKTSAFLRGLLKYTGMLKPEDMKRNTEEFVKDYMNVNNNGGIAAIDSKAEYQELKNNPVVADKDQMEFLEDKVYKYFGIHKNIVTSKYNEDEWNAFYESVIEPIAIQLSLEFTSKLFTEREKGHGNEIIFEANRLQYASAKTKISLLKDLAPFGMFTINEGREIFNLAPLKDGDRTIQTLNVVNSDKADEYQVGSKGGDDDDEKGNDPTTTDDEHPSGGED